MTRRIDKSVRSLDQLCAEVSRCRVCVGDLPHGARPVIQVGAEAAILIAGQAPGRKVHDSGIAFDDASGDRLRHWMGVDHAQFYNPNQIAILPMGFCYPGSGNSGDLPPRPECAPLWRDKLLTHMPNIRLTLVIGAYAMAHYFPKHKGSLTALVKAIEDQPTEMMVLPHPSGRNNIWLKRNPWFDSDVLPELRRRVATALRS